MSRTSLHRPRHTRAVWGRPATGTRLLPNPHSPSPHLNPHYKRCPKAQRLRPGSDQPLFRSQHGRFPDNNRHALSQGQCQVRAPLTRRIRFASSGDAPERSVMSLPRAIAPFSDSPAADLAGRSEQSDNLRLKTNAPFTDSTVVTTGVFPTTNGGHGFPLPSLRMVEHFWWLRPPHSEISSRLFHIPSEVRGCRRAVTDVKHPLVRTTLIATGVDAFSRNRPGPSISSPSLMPFRGSARNLGLAHSPISALSTPSPRGACPPEADLSRPRSAIHPRKGRVSAPRGIPSLPLDHFPSRDDRPVAQGVGAPSGASTPLTPPSKGAAY